MPSRLQLRHVHVRNDPADEHNHVVQPLLVQQLHQPRADVHVRAAEDRQSDHVRILLQRGGGDLFGRLPEARVDHFHAGVPKRAGNDFGAAVVPVQPWLGDDDARLSHERLPSIDPWAPWAPRQVQVLCLTGPCAQGSTGPFPDKSPFRLTEIVLDRRDLFVLAPNRPQGITHLADRRVRADALEEGHHRVAGAPRDVLQRLERPRHPVRISPRA